MRKLVHREGKLLAEGHTARTRPKRQCGRGLGAPTELLLHQPRPAPPLCSLGLTPPRHEGWGHQHQKGEEQSFSRGPQPLPHALEAALAPSLAASILPLPAPGFPRAPPAVSSHQEPQSGCSGP